MSHANDDKRAGTAHDKPHARKPIAHPLEDVGPQHMAQTKPPACPPHPEAEQRRDDAVDHDRGEDACIGRVHNEPMKENIDSIFSVMARKTSTVAVQARTCGWW